MNDIHPLTVVYAAAALAVSLVLHEFAHAWTADRLGDHTPRQMGRLTLNPKPHIEPFGSLVLPAIMLLIVFFTGRPFVLAYGKPMPVNSWNLKKQNRDLVLIALAGPAMSLLLAFAFGAGLGFACGVPVVSGLLAAFVVVNVLLAAFNLLPMPPLDAARAITPFLPPRAREVFINLEQYGALFILLFVFLLGGLGFVNLVGAIADGIISLVPGGDCLGF